MNRVACLVVLAAVASALGASEAELKPVACLLDQPAEARGLYVSEADFYKPTEPKGTVNPHAVLALVRNGPTQVAIAIDSAKADAAGPDLIRFDFSGKGEFAGAQGAPLKITTGNGRLSAVFGPSTVTVQRDGFALPVTVRGNYNKSGNQRYAYIQFAAALEGRLAFGAKTYAVRVSDDDGDLAFHTKATAFGPPGRGRSVGPSDSIAIDTGDGSFHAKPVRAYYGHPVRVDGAWYQIDVSPDARRISCRPYTGETGQLRIARSQWSATLVGDRHILKIDGSAEPISVPADRYTPIFFELSVPFGPPGAAEGSAARLTCRPARGANTTANLIDATAGRTADVAIGPPLTASVGTRVEAGKAEMDFTLLDAAGLQAEVVLPVTGLVTPGVEVLDTGGQRVHEGEFRFG